MKILTKVVIRISDSKILEEESYEYEGPVALCGSGGGSSTSTTAPWTAQVPYLEDVYNQAQELSAQPLQQYGQDLAGVAPGGSVSTAQAQQIGAGNVAGFTPDQVLAQQLTENQSLMGSPNLNAAEQANLNIIQGNNLNPDTNPYLSQTYNEAANVLGQQFQEQTLPALNKAAIAQGAYGGDRASLAQGVAAGDLAQQLQTLATNTYGNAYQQGLQQQQAAIAEAPTLASADFAEIAPLAAVGQEQQQMNQSEINAAQSAFNFQQQAPLNLLGSYSNLVSGDVGGTAQGSYSGK